jgi:tetratricopeptide (TPR) repeat protein
VLFTLALFTKVEAFSFMPVFVLAEMLFAPETRGLPLLRRPFRALPWLRLAPFIAATAMYLVVWKVVSPLSGSATRAATGMTPYSYLCTQFSAWWYYLAELVAPVSLIADEQDFPISRSLLDPRTLLAFTGWAVVVYLAIRAARRVPVVTFVVGSYFLFLGPHSSLVPLAEMVNGHRPYLATAGLFILFAAALYLALARLGRWPVAQLVALAALLAVPLTILTYERNKVWESDFTLWRDTAAKSPNSPRAQMNYGLALMRKGQYAEAEGCYRSSIRLAPYYALAYTNLGIVLAAQGKNADAAAQYDRAVELTPGDSTVFYWRGLFRARQADLPGAIQDFQSAVNLNPSAFKELAALSESLIRAGRAAEAQPLIRRGEALDPAGFDRERTSFRSYYLPK